LSNDADEIPVEVNDEKITQSTSDKTDVFDENHLEENTENDSNSESSENDSSSESSENDSSSESSENDSSSESSENDSSSESSENESSIQKMKNLLENEKQKSIQCEDKLKRTLADFQNLEKKSRSDIQNGLNMGIDEFMINFIQIFDDFKRAIDAYSENKINTDGWNSIFKNMNSLLTKYNISSIDALGKTFDPKLHEAISIIEEPSLDDGTITKEIRKGYISQNRVIRPTLVEISKNSKEKTIGDEEWQKLLELI